MLENILKIAKNRLGLIAASTFSSIGTNIITGDVYLSIALPSRMFAPAYRSRNLALTNLSRSVEDGSTLVSPLIPWNVGGAFVTGALGIETLLYAPSRLLVGYPHVLDCFGPKSTGLSPTNR